jgi:hypothetical protein
MTADLHLWSPSRFRRLRRQVRLYARMIYRMDWLAMFLFARFEIVQRYAGRDRPGPPLPGATDEAAVLLQTGSPVQEIVRRVRADGIADGLRLAQDAVADVIVFAAGARCYGNGQRHRPLGRSTDGRLMFEDAVVGDYLDGIADCDAIRRLWRDPEIRAIARGCLGTRPLPLRSRLWWSFRSDRADSVLRAAHAQNFFHFDLDDWCAVKFFFYITDVAPENGPHIYVRKSHRKRAVLDQLSPFKGRSSRHITAKYGRDSLAVMLGPAGTGFVEDPYGFHTGTAVTGTARLILEIEYGVTRPPLVGPYCVPTIEYS